MKKILDFNSAKYILELVKKYFAKKEDIPKNVETTDNKVHTLTKPTQEQYPDAKCVKNYVDDVQKRVDNVRKYVDSVVYVVDLLSGKIKECSDEVNSKVGFTDIATNEKLCIVKGGASGVKIIDGSVCIDKATLAHIDGRIESYKPIVPSTLDYAVKTSLCDNHYQLSQAEIDRVLNFIGLYSIGNLGNGGTVYQNTAELYSLKFHDSETGKCSAEFWHNPSEGFWFEFRGEEGDRCFYLDFGSETVNKVTYHNVFCIYGNKGKLDFNNKSITGLADPTDNSDAATKHYVDTHTPTLEYATESEIDNIFVS